MENCQGWLLKYIICFGPNMIKEHYCEVTGYTKGRGKICAYLIIKYANCGNNHHFNLPHYVLRHKIDAKAC